MSTLCRDCGHRPPPDAGTCPACGSARLLSHAELHDLAIAHLDCDAFYAAIEKRDRPELRDVPVIVGGRHRGVVAACCYIARTYGVRSAMPMFRALKACPDAAVVRPDMKKYAAVGREVRAMMLDLTPLVEPLSIDEAFMDLSGTVSLHRASPAETLARLARRVEGELSITVSIGLSYNKFLAKIASDLDKPRGFAVLGRTEAQTFLAGKPVGLLWGVGEAMRRRLARDGITRIGELARLDEGALMARYGKIGRRLHLCARGEDDRPVDPDREARSMSSEITLDEDVSDAGALRPILWQLAETLARRMKKAGIAGGGVTLKLKTADFRILTRARRLKHRHPVGRGDVPGGGAAAGPRGRRPRLPPDRDRRARSRRGREGGSGRPVRRRRARRGRGRRGAGRGAREVRRRGHRQGARLRNETRAAGAVQGGVSRPVHLERRLEPPRIEAECRLVASIRYTGLLGLIDLRDDGSLRIGAGTKRFSDVGGLGPAQ